MKYRGLEFSYDELTSFREAFDGTPLEKMLRDVIQQIRDNSKVELQKTSLNLESIRVQQGVIQGMIVLKDVIKDLLEFDVDEYMKVEVENTETEVEDEDVQHFDF